MRNLAKDVYRKYKVLSDLKDEILVYHVTYANRLESIAQHGLKPNSTRSIGSPSYDFHAKGKVFLTDFDGVRFWMSKAEDFANHNSDHPLTDLYVPVVVSTSKVKKEDLKEDELGTKDAGGSKAWFLTKGIPARNLEVWDGHGWTSLSEHESIDFSQAFTLEESDEEDGETLEWFKNESPFLPHEE